MPTCLRDLLGRIVLSLPKSVLVDCRELAYFVGKMSKNRMVCKNAIALAYYGSCRFSVMSSLGSWWQASRGNPADTLYWKRTAVQVLFFSSHIHYKNTSIFNLHLYWADADTLNLTFMTISIIRNVRNQYQTNTAKRTHDYVFLHTRVIALGEKYFSNVAELQGANGERTQAHTLEILHC